MSSEVATSRVGVLSMVALGGMLGATGRHLVNQWLGFSGPFPWSTFAVNAAGSFLLGLFLVAVIERTPPGHYLRPFVATGVLGAFTTMATYQIEVTELLRDGHTSSALFYVASSLFASLGLAYFGVRSGRWLLSGLPGSPAGPRA